VTKIIASDLAGPWGIVQLDNSQFLVSNLKSNNLVVINRDGEVREIVKGLRSPTGVTLDGDYVYVSNTGSARRAIEWFHRDSIASSSTVIDSTDPSFVQPLVSGLQNVTNLVMASDDYLYMAYSLGSRGIVGRVDPVQCRDQGGCKASDVEIVVYTELAAPLAGLTISPDMRLYIHSIFSPDVYWVDLNKTQ
jgi:DNA-binding beta-propeller fold protein YncE